MHYRTALTAALLCFFSWSCIPTDKAGQVLGDYDISKPEKFFMPESLQEVSGISFYRQNNDTIYAIQDEEGKLFRLAWDKKKQYHTKFGKKGDYEDLTIINEKVYILKSDGRLYSFPFSESVYDEPDSVQEWKHLLPKGEYEGLFGDERSNSLYVLCKNCPGDNAKESVSGYVLQPETPQGALGKFKVNVNDIRVHSTKVKRGFRPSALAKNHLTNDWYILSAANMMIVVTDSDWKVKEVCALSGRTFNQPEGLAFDKAGNMYISNEGDDLVEGNILRFARKIN